VTFTPVTPAAGGGYIVAGDTVTAVLVAGSISVVLVSTGTAPSLQYQVTEYIGDGRSTTYVINPTGPSLDLSSVSRGSLAPVGMFVLTSSVGAAGGVAPLDGSSKVPQSFLPSTATGVTSVTAADGTITVGGTSAAPTVAVGSVPQGQVTGLTASLAGKVGTSTWSGKGAVVAATGAGVPAAVTVGTDGQVLTADSTQSAGVKWSTVSGGGGVTSVTAGDTTITVGGTGSAPTVAVNAIPESKVTGLVADLGGKVALSTVTTKGDLLAATGSATLARVGVGVNGQVLTADSTQSAGVKWSTPSGGGGSTIDPRAAMYGLLGVTMDPLALSYSAPQFIAMTDQRVYVYRAVVPAGTTITNVVVPIDGAGVVGSGSLLFRVYQSDGSVLGTTANSAGLTTTGTQWVTAALTAPAATTGAYVWVTALAVGMTQGPQLCFAETSVLPTWLPNPTASPTALRFDGQTSLPATLSPGSYTAYLPAIMGVS